MTTTLKLSAYEDVLLGIVRNLPIDRVVQIIDYARYIQSQPDIFQSEDVSEEEIRADEAHWSRQFEATQDGLKKMADKVRAEVHAGRTMAMTFTKEGKIIPG
jgi:hypothetical protein